MESSTKPKVLVTRKDIPQEALDKLMLSCEVDIYSEDHPIPQNALKEMIHGKDGLFCFLTDEIGADVLEAADPTLKVIATMSVGYDHLCLPDMKKRGIKVGNTPDVSTDAVAELAVALLLATGRRLLESHNKLRIGEWSSCDWSPLWMVGWGLSKSIVGFFGLGHIGQGVLKRLQGFHVKKFLYCDKARIDDDDLPAAEFVSFDELLEQCDFIIITAVLNSMTKDKFNRDAFSKMKNSAILINVARGGIINQDDLIEALSSKQIRAAGLDVMTPEPLPADHHILSLPNVTLLPHIGSAEYQARLAMAFLTVENITAALEGNQMPAQIC